MPNSNELLNVVNNAINLAKKNKQANSGHPFG